MNNLHHEKERNRHDWEEMKHVELEKRTMTSNVDNVKQGRQLCRLSTTTSSSSTLWGSSVRSSKLGFGCNSTVDSR